MKKNQICIISAYPDKKNERDGMMQRINAIDTLIGEKKRIYLELSFRRNFSSLKEIKTDKLTIYHLNCFLHFFSIMYLCLQSHIIYVHSIYNSIRILPVYFFKNVITDMHGVVVEELRMSHATTLVCILFSIVEYIVMKFGYKFIVVTDEMRKYFSQKYHINSSRYLCISIFQNDHKIKQEKEKKYNNTAIYCGGMQAWQCIPELSNLIINTKDIYNWIILTGEQQYLKNLFTKYRIYNLVKIKSVPREEVDDYYSNSTYGIVLRKDNIVNHVACPTKLIEYIEAGLVPVVLSPYIGDFYKMGYSYIDYRVFERGAYFSKEKLMNMAKHNMSLLRKIKLDTQKNIQLLKNIFNGED